MSLTPLQNVAIVLIAVGFLILLWWISTQFSADFDLPPTRPQSNSVRAGQDRPSQGDKVVDVESDERPMDEVPDESHVPPNNDKVSEATALEFSTGRRGEREQIPPWVSKAARSSRLFVSPSGSKLPTFVVAHGLDEGSGFSSIAQAFQELPPSGGVVQLVGQGPFLLPPTQLRSCRHVAITGAQENRPLVVFLPDRNGNVDSLLQVTNGSLLLRGVDFAVATEQFSQDGELTLMAVDSGDLIVQNCSVTLQAGRKAGICAFRITGAPNSASGELARPARILLDRLFVRGRNLSILDIDQPLTDLLASNSLFVTENAPLVRLTNTSNSVPAENAAEAPARVLRFFSCTAAARETGFELMAGSHGARPPTTKVLLLNSLIATDQASREAVFASLTDWPMGRGRDPNRPVPTNLTWSVRSTLVLGWDVLLRGPRHEAFNVRDASGWREMWQEPVEPAQFQAGGWPEMPVSSFVDVTPEELDRETIDVAGVKATDGGHPGCDIALVSVPATFQLQRAWSISASKNKKDTKEEKGATRPNF